MTNSMPGKYRRRQAESRLSELDPFFDSRQKQERGYADGIKELAEKEMRAGHYTFAMQMAEGMRIILPLLPGVL